MNNPQPTPSPMEDSRELDQLIQAIYKNGHFDGRWSVKGDKESTAKFDVWKEALLRDRRKSDIRARIDENQSIEDVLEYEVLKADFCDNHEKHVAQCYGCRLKKWRGVICKEYLGVIRDRLVDLKVELQQLESEE